MIDLETMGTRPDAPIISIGAVAFNAMGITDQTFYRNVSLRSSVQSGAVIDPSTVMWWLRQDKVAQAAFEDGQDEAVALTQALYDFTQFLCSYGDSLKGVWGNGASFDNVIMHESGRRCGVPMWEFWKDRCYRTIKGCYPDVPFERGGTHHNALDDARSQALHLIAINEKHSIL
jgi:exodeoxyribonuclease VIII